MRKWKGNPQKATYKRITFTRYVRTKGVKYVKGRPAGYYTSLVIVAEKGNKYVEVEFYGNKRKRLENAPPSVVYKYMLPYMRSRGLVK